MTFKARLTSKTNDQPSTAGVDFNEVDLMPGDVTVAIDYSTVNYKDALAVSGRAPVIRHYPGSHTLANVLAQTRYRGTVAAFGLAQGALVDVPRIADQVLRGEVRGRTVVDVNS